MIRIFAFVLTITSDYIYYMLVAAATCSVSELSVELPCGRTHSSSNASELPVVADGTLLATIVRAALRTLTCRNLRGGA